MAKGTAGYHIRRLRAFARWLGLTGLAACIGAVGSAKPLLAACNLIPQTVQTFNGVVGSTNRPFAAPGEPIEVAVRPCDSSSSGLNANLAAQLVTVLFTPPFGGTPSAAVVTAGTCSALSAQLAACASQLGGGQAVCIQGSAAGLQVLQRPGGLHLQFLFPNTDALVGNVGDALTLAGPATIAVTSATAPLPCQLATATCHDQASSITGMAACIDDFFTGDGACGTSRPQGTFNHFTALPFPNDFAGACIDETPPCNPTATQLRLTADLDGNALLPMDWRGILVRSGGVPFPRLLSASLATPLPITFPGQSFFASFSPDGGPLAPIFVPQFDSTAPSSVLSLFGSADAPYTVLRIARRSEHFMQCHGGVHNGLACNEQDDCPALCSGGSNAGQRCTSNAQCPGGACSAPSPGSCGPTVCSGGTNAGQPCTADSFCPGGECGPPVFGLAPLVYAGNGPVVLPRVPGVCAGGTNSGATCTTIGDCPDSFCLSGGFCQQDTSQSCSMTNACSSVPCVDFQLTAENPIPLASLAAQTANVFGLSSLEAVDLVDRNGDGDTSDAVVTLRDRTTGALQSLGAPAECLGRSTLVGTPPPTGRAVVQISRPPFVFPAVVTAGDLVAFLESEPTEGTCDTNSNHAIFDSILRVFRLGAVDLTAGMTETVDAAPVINARSVAISNGRVFFRKSEMARAQQQTTRVNVDSTGSQSDGYSFPTGLSADGRYVVLGSPATNLVPGDTNLEYDAFVRDRLTGVTERVSVSLAGGQGDGFSAARTISADGRYVVFDSDATNLVTGDTNSSSDVFVHDRLTGVTERLSVSSAGVQADGHSYDADISADGRYVAFDSFATNLVAGDTNGQRDVFVHDRLTGVTKRVSVSTTGGQGDLDSIVPVISADGRYVAFESGATNLVADDTNGTDVFVHNRLSGVTERVSASSDGSEADADSGNAAISADGRYVAFESDATNLVAGDTNGMTDVFAHDRLTGVTERVSIDSSGSEGTGMSHNENHTISADGRYITFASLASDLVPGDANGTSDVFVHDRLTGATQRVSVDAVGAGGGNSDPLAISADGRYVAFESSATDLVAGDTNGVVDAFVRGVDGTDTASDVTGDGVVRDLVLAMLDTTQALASPVALCPAEVASVAGGAAAFLRPESAGATPNLPNCPAGTAVTGGVDLNGNGSATDAVVHLALTSSTIQNLGVAATALSLSGACAGGAHAGYPCTDTADCPGSSCTPSFVAALVSEAAQNAKLNSDADKTDTVVEVHPAGNGAWINVQQAADAVQVEGTLVAFITPEAAQGNTNLNGDNDSLDRVLQIFDAATNTTANTTQAAEEFVMGTQPASCGSGPIVAFRTSEAAQGHTDLNGDNDATDYVLQLYVPGIGLINTHEAVTPCALPACDPSQPYLVQGDTVKFLTYEGDQKQDLDLNGSQTDLILQIFDACKGTLTVAGHVDTTAGSSNPLTNGGTTTDSKVVFATTAGVCVSGLITYPVPAMCNSDGDCPPGASCQPGNPIVAAPAAIYAHDDSVVTPPTPLTITIPVGTSSVAATLKVKVRNGDVLPRKARARHTVQLTVSDGSCPAGTVAGVPDFDAKTAGAQDRILLKSGTAKTATVPLTITRSAFATVNALAPLRCALSASVVTTGVDNSIDPTPANDSVPVELNVIDQNVLPASSPGDAVIQSAKPAKLTIGKLAKTMSATKTVTVKLLNADSATTTLTPSVDDGTCPVGTVHVSGPAFATVGAGKQATVKLAVTATDAGFLTASAASPSRCIATVSVAGPGTDPDPTNNTTQLVIDVTDKEDF